MKIKGSVFLCFLAWEVIFLTSTGAALAVGVLPTNALCCKGSNNTYSWLNYNTSGWCPQGGDRFTYAYGVYSTGSAAEADRGPHGYNSNSTMWYACENTVEVWYATSNTVHGGCGSNLGDQGLFFAPKANSGYNAALCVTDSDNDGIPDPYDPYPDDDTSFKWRKTAEFRDANGNLKAIVVKTDRGDTFILGDEAFVASCNDGSVECKQSLFISADDSYPNGAADWVALFEGLEIIPAGEAEEWKFSDSTVIDGERQVTPATGITSGVTSSQGDSDSTLLGKIVDNTSKLIAAAQVIADRVKAVEQTTREQLTGQTVSGASGSGSGSGSGSSSSVQTGVGGALQAKEDSDLAATSTDRSTLGAFNPSASINTDPFTESDASEPKKTGSSAIAGLLDTFLANNPLNGLANGQYLSFSGPACSFSSLFEWANQSTTIEFSLCPYSDNVDLLGSLLFAWVSILAVFKFFE